MYRLPFSELAVTINASSSLVDHTIAAMSLVTPEADFGVLYGCSYSCFSCLSSFSLDNAVVSGPNHSQFKLASPVLIQLQQKSSAEDAEIASMLDDIETKLKDMLKKLEQFQLKNADNVFNTVMTYMPQDFRGILIRQQRERSERISKRRRVQLAQLGSATGVYKRLLLGIWLVFPQVLLDFIRQINDDNGPMEEQRERYGPALYTLTKLVLAIRLYLHVSLARYGQRKIEKDDIAVLQQAVVTYTEEFEKFLKFIGEVFVNAPFFISAEDAGAADQRKSDEYKETIIPAGKTHEVILSVEAVNSYIAWDFSLQQGALSMVLDIGFHVEYISPSGEKTLILPYRRYEADQGNFCTVLAGSYKLVWDNTYSSFFKKSLRYKVDAVPPVIEPAAVPTVEP
ncbi:hypothetical protein PR202_gb00809 [Eleusine coracana subsp. coracana]|uniref:GOLD domain-containing protein n=1 Tax=Eleusine coracana subsp. coracana TaxID=191504 RepID=A0AAV5DTH7_ELECO|nr:hypothetical protein PR202_gb00809 [Eleusine coracana subsp. coracana]